MTPPEVQKAMDEKDVDFLLGYFAAEEKWARYWVLAQVYRSEAIRKLEKNV